MYHEGRGGAVAFVDFDTATFEGPTLERAGEVPGTPFWASPLQMVPPEASVSGNPGDFAAWATAEHDRYSCALMGLKMWCDAAGTARANAVPREGLQRDSQELHVRRIWPRLGRSLRPGFRHSTMRSSNSRQTAPPLLNLQALDRRLASLDNGSRRAAAFET